MIKVSLDDIYRDNYGWLDTYQHFSFADYYNPNNMNFGDIRVINDDIVASGHGFDLHPHRNMEVINYIVKGELTHRDSLNNWKVFRSGSVLHMSAGTGINHSEFNYGNDDLRILQVWIIPDKKDCFPRFRDYEYGLKNRQNTFIHLASGWDGEAPLRLNQDADILVGEFTEDASIEIDSNKKAYGIIIEGDAKVNNVVLKEREAFKVGEGTIEIEVRNKVHIMIIQTRY